MEEICVLRSRRSEFLLRKVNLVAVREALGEAILELQNGEPVSGNPCGIVTPDELTSSSGAQRRFMTLSDQIRALLSDKQSDVYVKHTTYMEKLKHIESIAIGSRILLRSLESGLRTSDSSSPIAGAKSPPKSGLLKRLLPAIFRPSVQLVSGDADHTKALETGQAALQLVAADTPDSDAFHFQPEHISRFSCVMLEASSGRTCQSFDTSCEMCRVSYVINRYLEMMSSFLLKRLQLSDEIFGDRVALDYETLFFEELHEPLFDFMITRYTPTLNLIRLHASLVRPADLVSADDIQRSLPLFRALYYGLRLPPHTEPSVVFSSSSSSSSFAGCTSRQPPLQQLFLQAASKLRHCRSPHALAQELWSLVRSLMRTIEPYFPMVCADELIVWLSFSLAELASASCLSAAASASVSISSESHSESTAELSSCVLHRDSVFRSSAADNQTGLFREKHESGDTEEREQQLQSQSNRESLTTFSDSQTQAQQQQPPQHQQQEEVSLRSAASDSSLKRSSCSSGVPNESATTADTDSNGTRTSDASVSSASTFATCPTRDSRNLEASAASSAKMAIAAREDERLDALCSLYLSAQYLQHMLSARERQAQASYCCTQLSGALFMLIESLQNRIRALSSSANTDPK